MEVEHFDSKSHSLPFFLKVIFAFVFAIPLGAQTQTDDMLFSFTKFDPTTLDMNLEGDAYLAAPNIELTKSSQSIGVGDSIGRATYQKPLHLWDNKSRNLADFTTHFSFIINSEGSTTKGYGFAFFLAPKGSQLLPSSGVSSLGLLSSTTSDKFIAVIFDTDQTSLVENTDQIRINLSSTDSVQTKAWSRNEISDGGRIEAWIYYNSSSKNLSVSVDNGCTDSGSRNICSYSLSYIVDLRDYLPDWVTFGFSAATNFMDFERHQISSWNFTSSLQLSPENQPTTPQLSPENQPTTSNLVTPTQTSSTRRKTNMFWLWFVVGACGALVLVSGFVWFFCWIKRRPNIDEDDDFINESGPRSFSYKELEVGTNKFSGDKLLGKGGSGNVYEGILGNRKVAVKRITADSEQGLKEYQSEVKAISRSRHKNLLKLIGWCRKKQEFFIVYEFMPNNSLDFHLVTGTGLTWEKRYNIAKGLAKAVRYLQEEGEQCILHRDIKSSNVLLDSNFNAKLGDFGLARILEHGERSKTTLLIGTPGYVAPEYEATSKPTKQSDVYSFGIVALEIASGKLAQKRVDNNAMGHSIKMVEWVWKEYGSGNISAIADPKLGQDFPQEEMKCLIVVGLACAHPNHADRPSIGKAIDILTGKISLPDLPSEMPVPPHIAAHRANMFSISRSSANTTGAGGSDTGQSQFPGTSSNSPTSDNVTASSNPA